MYYPPPDEYEPPKSCEMCYEPIQLTACIGTERWVHVYVQKDPHDVVMRPEGWWNTQSGTTIYGPLLLHKVFEG